MIKAIRGTRDLLPPETALWNFVEAAVRDVFRAYNFHEIRTPIFEDTQLFARSVGEDTDIVSKEMYTWWEENRTPEQLLQLKWLLIQGNAKMSFAPARIPKMRYEPDLELRPSEEERVVVEFTSRPSSAKLELLGRYATTYQELLGKRVIPKLVTDHDLSDAL